MKNPPPRQPDRKPSPNWAAFESESAAWHTNSGVGNKAAYLIVDGDTFNGKTVTALGLEQDRGDLLRGGHEPAHVGEQLPGSLQRAAAGVHEPDRHARDHHVRLQRGQGRARRGRDECRSGDRRGRSTRPCARPAFPRTSTSTTSRIRGAATGRRVCSPARTTGTTRRTRTPGPTSTRPTRRAAPRTSSASIARPAPTRSSRRPRTSRSRPASRPICASTTPTTSSASARPAYLDGGVVEYSTNNGATWNDAGSLFTHGG